MILAASADRRHVRTATPTQLGRLLELCAPEGPEIELQKAPGGTHLSIFGTTALCLISFTRARHASCPRRCPIASVHASVPPHTSARSCTFPFANFSRYDHAKSKMFEELHSSMLPSLACLLDEWWRQCPGKNNTAIT